MNEKCNVLFCKDIRHSQASRWDDEAEFNRLVNRRRQRTAAQERLRKAENRQRMDKAMEKRFWCGAAAGAFGLAFVISLGVIAGCIISAVTGVM